MSPPPSAAPPALPDHPLLAGAVLRPSGEGAVVVEWGDRIDETAQARALALADALAALAPPGLVEALPTYRSTLVEFDPARTDLAALVGMLPPETGRTSGRVAPTATWHVPVCLEGAAAEDLDEAATELGLTPDDVRTRIVGSPLRVGMYGFVPGFAYLHGLDPRLDLPRRAAPRPPIPPGAFIIAVGQAGIVPVSMPTGWYVVGRSAARMFDASRVEEGRPPVPFAIGDGLRVEAVDEAALLRLAGDPEGGIRRVEDGAGRVGA